MFLMGVGERSGALTENPHADVGRTRRLNTEIPSSLGELNTGDGANCYTAALPYRESMLQFPCGKGHPGLSDPFLFFSVRVKSPKKLHVLGCSRCEILVANIKCLIVIREGQHSGFF